MEAKGCNIVHCVAQVILVVFMVTSKIGAQVLVQHKSYYNIDHERDPHDLSIGCITNLSVIMSKMLVKFMAHVVVVIVLVHVTVLILIFEL